MFFTRRQVNHSMALLHCYLSWSLVLPTASVALQLLALSLAAWRNLLAVGLAGATGPGGLPHQLQLALASHTLAMTSMLVFLAASGLALAALIAMTAAVLRIFRVLNPDKQQLFALGVFNWAKCWGGILINNAILPLCMAYTFATPHVVWSGIRYTRASGKVARVDTAWDSGVGGKGLLAPAVWTAAIKPGAVKQS